jgi:uroporphyrinogen-III synthase
VSGLAGRRVVVTRSADRAAPFVRALARAGAIPILLPLIETRPPADPAPAEAALDRIANFDWIAFTSVHSVGFFAARWESRKWPLPCPPRIAVVGPVTAEAARSAGLPVHAQAREFRGDALPAALGDPGGRRVLLPRSDLGRDETAAALTAAGAHVEDVVFYRTVPVALDDAARRALEPGADVLTFFSPSAVRAFLALGEDARRLAAGARIACIGPVTAGAARAAGLTVAVQPPVFTGEALVLAIEESS